MAADFMCGSGAGWLAGWLPGWAPRSGTPLTLSPHRPHPLREKKKALFTGKHSRPLVV